MALIRLPPVLDLVRDPFSMTVQRDSEPCRLADPQLFRTPASIFGWELGRCLAVSLLSQGSYGKYRIWFFDAAEETSDKCVDHANQAIYVNATWLSVEYALAKIRCGQDDVVERSVNFLLQDLPHEISANPGPDMPGSDILPATQRFLRTLRLYQGARAHQLMVAWRANTEWAPRRGHLNIQLHALSSCAALLYRASTRDFTGASRPDCLGKGPCRASFQSVRTGEAAFNNLDPKVEYFAVAMNMVKEDIWPACFSRTVAYPKSVWAIHHLDGWRGPKPKPKPKPPRIGLDSILDPPTPKKECVDPFGGSHADDRRSCLLPGMRTAEDHCQMVDCRVGEDAMAGKHGAALHGVVTLPMRPNTRAEGIKDLHSIPYHPLRPQTVGGRTLIDHNPPIHVYSAATPNYPQLGDLQTDTSIYTQASNESALQFVPGPGTGSPPSAESTTAPTHTWTQARVVFSQADDPRTSGASTGCSSDAAGPVVDRNGMPQQHPVYHDYSSADSQTSYMPGQRDMTPPETPEHSPVGRVHMTPPETPELGPDDVKQEVFTEDEVDDDEEEVRRRKRSRSHTCIVIYDPYMTAAQLPNHFVDRPNHIDNGPRSYFAPPGPRAAIAEEDCHGLPHINDALGDQPDHHQHQTPGGAGPHGEEAMFEQPPETVAGPSHTMLQAPQLLEAGPIGPLPIWNHRATHTPVSAATGEPWLNPGVATMIPARGPPRSASWSAPLASQMSVMSISAVMNPVNETFGAHQRTSSATHIPAAAESPETSIAIASSSSSAGRSAKSLGKRRRTSLPSGRPVAAAPQGRIRSVASMRRRSHPHISAPRVDPGPSVVRRPAPGGPAIPEETPEYGEPDWLG